MATMLNNNLNRLLSSAPRCCFCGATGSATTPNIRKTNEAQTQEAVTCFGCGGRFTRTLPMVASREDEARWLSQSRMARAVSPWFS